MPTPMRMEAARSSRPALHHRTACLARSAGLAAALACLLLFAGAVWAKPQHGVSLGGQVKYPPNFTHFDYANPDAPKGGSLTLASTSNFDTINTFALKGREAPLLVDARLGILYEQLMRASLDEPFAAYGLLAESIDIAKDGLSVVFRLNPKARFSDGSPVTADDVVYSLKLMRSPDAKPLYRYYYQDIAAAEAVNRRTVRFRFRRRNRELAMIVSELSVLPRHFYEGKDFGRDFGATALASGPYKVAEFETGKHITYVRRPDYWGRDLPANKGKYNFDRIEVKIYRDPTVELEGLKAGEFDYMRVDLSKQWALDVAGERWDKHYLVKELLEHHNTAGMQGYAFNLRRPIFADRQVRKALALAFDFQWSNENLFYGQYTALDSYFDNSELAAEGLPSPEELKLLTPLKGKLPPEVFTEPMGKPLGTGLTMRERLRESKRLLNAAGWAVRNGVLTETATGRPMRFTVLLVQPAFERITEPWLDNLRRLGVQATMKVVDSSVYEGLRRTFDFDVIVDSVGQSPSPGNEQREYWHSAAAKIQGSRNRIGVSDPAVDALVEAIIAARSRKALVTATRALDRALWYGYYMVPQWYIGQHRVTYWNRLRRPKTLPLYYTPGWFVMFWWYDAALDAALQKAMAAGRPLVLPR